MICIDAGLKGINETGNKYVIDDVDYSKSTGDKLKNGYGYMSVYIHVMDVS